MGCVQNFLFGLPYFIALIGLLIFVHEAGHFLFAKLFRVKVHAFSLGFGPKLFGFRRGETEYKVSLVPVGGYVKMLGEDPAEDVAPEDRGRAFGDRPLWQRFFIIAAGPAMNIAFPLFLHFGVGLSFTEVDPAEVGVVLPGMPAERAGLLPGDVIRSVDGRPVHSFIGLVKQVAPRPGQPLHFTIQRGREILERTVIPRPTEVTVLLNEKETIGLIGIGSGYLPALVGVPDPGSGAAASGLRSFDLITAVNGRPVERLIALEKQLAAAAGSRAVLTVRRLRSDAAPPFEPFADQFEKKPLEIPIDLPAGLTRLDELGIESARDYVVHVTSGGAAEKIGLKKGDRLRSLDGVEYRLGQIFGAIDESPDRERALAWTRDGRRFEARFKPKFIPAGEAGDLGIRNDQYDKGFWGLGGEQVMPAPVRNPELVTGAIRYAGEETWSGLRLIGIGFKLLFTGRVSLRSLGGPIMIGQLAVEAGRQGASAFFWIMALVSLNLGVLNLLPIPVLDGGQIVFIAIEAVTRQPISRAVKERVMLAGVVMLLLLMVFATWNDIARILVG